MQQDTLVAIADAQQGRDLARFDPLDVAQHDDVALRCRKLWQELTDTAGEAGGHDPVVDLVRPRDRGLTPLAVGVEAIVDVAVGAPGAPFRVPLRCGRG